MRIETEKGYGICKTRTVCGNELDMGIYAVTAVVNDLAAEGACILNGCSVSVLLVLPLRIANPYKYKIIKEIKKTCRICQVKLVDIREERKAALTECMIVVTGISCAADTEVPQQNRFLPGQQIILTKWAGLEGTLRIIDKEREKLRKRFALPFLKQIEGLKPELSALPEIEAAKKNHVFAIRQMGEGGIFTALWRLAEETGLGLDINLKHIPVRQETIEICEYFRLNPYQLASAGSMLMVTDDAKALADLLHRENIEASVIGSLTDNHDKIIRNGEEIRYIDRPAPDELNKLLREENYAG